MKKNIDDFELFEKSVLVRVDFNVPIEDGKIISTNRIDEAIPTIKALIDKNAKITLVSHLGRPDGERKEEFSLKPVYEYLKANLPTKVYFCDEVANDKMNTAVEKLKNGEVLLLENVRYYKEEENCDDTFSKNLAKPFDLFVMDAFGTAHRKHASTYGVTKYLPSAIGYLVQKELEYLEDTIKSPKKPFVAILGGAKVKDKLKMVDNLLDKVNVLIIGGGMAFTFIKALKGNIGNSIVDNDQIEYCFNMIKKAMNNKVKLLLPIDALCGENLESNECEYYKIDRIPNTQMGLDIGNKSIQIFKKQIKKAKTILINGPMGAFENSLFKNGTKEVLEAIAKNKKAIKIAGGGDTTSAIEKFNLKDKFTHVSTGGGASLKLLEGNGLDCINVIEEKV